MTEIPIVAEPRAPTGSDARNVMPTSSDAVKLTAKLKLKSSSIVANKRGILIQNDTLTATLISMPTAA